MQVMDFTALGAQAVAQVERAQRAAREQLVAAMNQRPKLSLKLELEGPKIAIPLPEADPQGGSFHWRPVLPCSCSIPPGICAAGLQWHQIAVPRVTATFEGMIPISKAS